MRLSGPQSRQNVIFRAKIQSKKINIYMKYCNKYKNMDLTHLGIVIHHPDSQRQQQHLCIVKTKTRPA